ncbi:MAG: hypothetical protein ACR2QX_00330 [Woeseiaceae bacterium]
MTSRTALFAVSNEKGDENEKLVELFKNRAELKKEFAKLRKEQYRLQQRVKEQQGATARITQKLEHLESLLVDAEWVHTVVVFYQLRALNKRCRSKLAKFAEQLKQQRERRLQDGQHTGWQQDLKQEMAALQQQIGEHRMHVQVLEDRLQAERHRLDSMSGLAKVMKGRAASGEVDEITAQLADAQQVEQELLTELDTIKDREPPDAPGLGIGDKRSINFTIIAFAQQLYLQFRDQRLASLVKESGDKSVGAINYGGKDDCDKLLALAQKQADSMEKLADFADVLKRRTALISEHAVFKDDDDVVPIPGTVATVFAIDANGVVREKDVNLLGENYWGLSDVLSR